MKTMLVTGASSGIGRALAIRAARAGYAVYAVGRNREALAALREKISGESGFVSVEVTDVAIPANARGLVARALAQFGSIDVLVNNAGFVSAGRLAAQSDDELQRQFGTHVIGPVALVREALDALRAARGHVFMLGSGVARVPVGSLGAYPPAKAAIRSATSILRRELRPLGVAVTYVDPGAVDTPFMKRAGMPGAPARFLVSPEAVARKILIAVADRPRELNASVWQTALVALAERFPQLTDALLERAPALVGGGEAPLGSATVKDAEPVGAQRDKPTSSGTARPDGGTPDEISADTVVPNGAPGDETVTEILLSEPVLPKQHAPGAGLSVGNSVDEASRDIVLPDGAPPLPVSPERTSALSPFDGALEPHRRRMDKLNLRDSFVRDLLVFDTTLETGDIALRWAGMPNKNERAITETVLEALADAGFLERSGEHTYRVVRTP